MGAEIDKLNKQECKVLRDLAISEKEKIHKEAIHNIELRDLELSLDFIIIKLNVKLQQSETVEK